MIAYIYCALLDLLCFYNISTLSEMLEKMTVPFCKIWPVHVTFGGEIFMGITSYKLCLVFCLPTHFFIYHSIALFITLLLKFIGVFVAYALLNWVKICGVFMNSPCVSEEFPKK